MPGSQNGDWASNAAITGSQAWTSAGLKLASTAGSPAWWESRKRTGISSFPNWANSGQ